MPTKSLMNRYKKKDVDQITKSLIRARNATQQAIDRFYKYKPDGKIKSLTNSATFKKQSGVRELEKQVKLLDRFIDKMLPVGMTSQGIADTKKRMDAQRIYQMAQRRMKELRKEGKIK